MIIDKNWHVHTDLSGKFRWLVQGKPPAQADVRIIKFGHTQLRRKMSLAQMQQPIVVYRMPYPKDGPQLSAVRVYKAPPVEADFDDEVWSRSPVASKFWLSSKSGAQNIPLKAKFAYDESFLYSIVHVGPGDLPGLADEDTIEFFIDPGKDWYNFGPFQLFYNAKGRIIGAFGWNCPWPNTHAKKHPDGSWTVSIAASWQVLDMSHPKAGTVIGLGLAHIQPAKGEQAADASSAKVGPPAVFRFGRLVLE